MKKSLKKQIDKEALITIGTYCLYFIWWYYFAYIYPPKDPKDYEYIFGFPKWFFYSCIVGFILFNFIVFFVVKIFFKDIDFQKEIK